MDLIERAQALAAFDAGFASAEECRLNQVRTSTTWRLTLKGTTVEERIKSARHLLKDCTEPTILPLLESDLAMAQLVKMPSESSMPGIGNGQSERERMVREEHTSAE